MPKQKNKKISLSDKLFLYVFQPWMTVLLIMINVGVYSYIKLKPISLESVSRFVLTPASLLNGKFLTVITSGFLHGNLHHLFFNMVGLFVFGRAVELKFGPFKTLVIYLGALALSMFFAILIYVFILHKNMAIIGASGAVMGLLSCAMLINPFDISYEMILPIPVMIKGWIFISADFQGFLGGEPDGVSHLAHLLGFVSIALLFYFLNKEEQSLMTKGIIINLLSFSLFLFLWKYYF
jgi:membrane associated rhomboid family serine protease